MLKVLLSFSLSLSLSSYSQAGTVNWASEGKIVTYTLLVAGGLTLAAGGGLGKARDMKQVVDSSLSETIATVAGYALVGAGAIGSIGLILFDLSKTDEVQKKATQARYRSIVRNATLVIKNDSRASSNDGLADLAKAVVCEKCSSDQEKAALLANLISRWDDLGKSIPSGRLTNIQEGEIETSIAAGLNEFGLKNDTNIAIGKTMVALAKFSTM